MDTGGVNDLSILGIGARIFREIWANWTFYEKITVSQICLKGT